MPITAVKICKGRSHRPRLLCRITVGRSLMFVFKEVFTTPLYWAVSSAHPTLARKEATVDF